MTSRISYNIHGQRVLDHDKLIRHLLKIKPAAVLVMDGLGLCREIKSALPDTLVISRIYPDSDINNRISPEQWLDQRAAQTEGGIFAYTTNEAGFSPNLINWHIRLMELAVKGRVPLVIGNMSVGTPAAEDWEAGKRLLELLDQHRDLFILGLHEYACGVITSGFLGGYPDNAGVAPNSGQKGRNLIQPSSWPSKAEAATITMFHCGRFKFLVNYCKSIGLRPPRIILTEHGFDDVSDIKGWSERLQMTPPYKDIRGWKSVQNQWRAWYQSLGWSPDRAMFEQLAYADRTIYQGSAVEAQLIFCWGHTSDMWDQFDVAQADEFQGYLEGYAIMQPPITTPPTTPPVPVYPKLPAPDDARWQKVIAAPINGAVNVRSVPDKSGGQITQIKAVGEIYVLTAESHGIWTPVKIPVNAPGAVPLLGWVSTDVITFLELPPETQEPSKTISLSREETLVLAGKYHSAALATLQSAQEIQTLADHLTELANRPSN